MVTSVKIWPTRTDNKREVQAFRRGQNDDNFKKANKVVGGVEDNIVILAIDGDIKDSGKSFNDVVLRDSNMVYPVSNYDVEINDERILVKCTTANINIKLPVCNARTYVIEKIDTTAFKVIVSGQIGEVINGEATFEILYQYESIEPTKTNKILSGSDWLI